MWNANLKEQSEVFTNFLQSQSYVCSREFGSKPFHVTVSNSHQGYNEYSLKKPPANGYFFVFLFGPLCTWDMFHDTTMKKNGLYVFLPATSEPTQYCGSRQELIFLLKKKKKECFGQGPVSELPYGTVEWIFLRLELGLSSSNNNWINPVGIQAHHRRKTPLR